MYVFIFEIRCNIILLNTRYVIHTYYSSTKISTKNRQIKSTTPTTSGSSSMLQQKHNNNKRSVEQTSQTVDNYLINTWYIHTYEEIKKPINKYDRNDEKSRSTSIIIVSYINRGKIK